MLASNEREKRQSIIDACRSMNVLGINQGTSGNIVTPSVARRTRLSARRNFQSTPRALADRLAYLLEHRGVIAVGPSLSMAMWLAVEVETLARQYHGCLQIGTPRLPPRAEIKDVLGRIVGYGPAGT